MGAESAQADPVVGADDCAAKPAREEVALMSSDPTDAGAVAMARRGIFLCKPGQPIAHRVDVPADSPRNPGQAILSELRLGKNVIWDPKQAAYVSYVAGHATLRQGKLDAEEVLELSDDVDGIDGVSELAEHGAAAMGNGISLNKSWARFIPLIGFYWNLFA